MRRPVLATFSLTFVAMLFVFAAARAFTAVTRTTRINAAALAGAILVAALATLTACGGGGGVTPPPTSKTYEITISGSAGNLMHSASVELVVD